MHRRKTIAMVAHDACKADMAAWAMYNYLLLLEHHLLATGTTGRLIEEAILHQAAVDGVAPPADFGVLRLKSGPLGGDQQVGALIADGKVDLLVFFWDPLETHPHEPDVKALLRIAVVYNVPVCCNRSTADFMVSSPLMRAEYEPLQRDYSQYVQREVKMH